MSVGTARKEAMPDPESELRAEIKHLLAMPEEWLQTKRRFLDGDTPEQRIRKGDFLLVRKLLHLADATFTMNQGTEAQPTNDQSLQQIPDQPTGSIAHLQRTNPKEWARQFHEWAEGHDRTTPLLSDEAISRESIYADRV